jgi:hypothetical protein
MRRKTTGARSGFRTRSLTTLSRTMTGRPWLVKGGHGVVAVDDRANGLAGVLASLQSVAGRLRLAGAVLGVALAGDDRVQQITERLRVLLACSPVGR